MIAISTSLIALAAGVYLLSYIKQYSLGSLYRNLAWVVVLLSLTFVSFGITNELIERRHGCDRGMSACPHMRSDCPMDGHIKCSSGNECHMRAGHSECNTASECCAMSGKGSTTECCSDKNAKHEGCPEMKADAKSDCCKKSTPADSSSR